MVIKKINIDIFQLLSWKVKTYEEPCIEFSRFLESCITFSRSLTKQNIFIDSYKKTYKNRKFVKAINNLKRVKISWKLYNL